jgi:hypothetical protein
MPLARSPRPRVRELVPALYPSHVRRRWLVLLKLYADVSGKDDLPVRACAGFVANEARWAKFESAWGQALKEAKVKQFHSTDFYACRGEFEGWVRGSPKHRRFSKRFCSIAEKHVYVGFVHGIEVDAFQRLLAPRLKGLRSLPNARLTTLMLCCMDVLRDASESLKPVAKYSLPMAALFEDEDGLGQAIGYYHRLKKIGMAWTQPYVSIGVGDKSFLPLQGADLLAHLSFRYFRRVLERRPGSRMPELAPPLKRLCQSHKMKLQLLTEEQIVPILPQLEQAVADGNLV